MTDSGRRGQTPASRSHTADRADIATLKSKVDLVDIVGGYVALTKKGSAHWGRCPFHADGTPSFKVDPARQEFHCFGCDAHGDVLDFLQRIERLDLADAIDRLRELAGTGRKAQPKPRAQAQREPSQIDRNGELAQELWRQSERIRDRLGLDYLVCRRGITEWDEDRVRWHPACPWLRERVGCIICPVVSHITGYTVAIWRIRPSMTEPMKGRRWGLGPTKGNCSPVWWPEGDELAIAEGVEDSLAVRQVTGLPCWAALSGGNMADLRGIPSWIRRVTIFADRDGVGLRGAHALADRLRSDGRSARVLRTTSGKDANDVLLAARTN